MSVYDPEARVDPGREGLVAGGPVDWDDRGILRFAGGPYADADPVDADTARLLIDMGYAPAESTQNRSPTMDALVAVGRRLAETYDVRVRFDGYVIPPHRDDARVTFTTVRLEADEIAVQAGEEAAIPEACQIAFEQAFGGADEFRADPAVCTAWWD